MGTEKQPEKTARVIIEVTAGIIPGQSIPENTKRWVITSEEWYNSTDQLILLSEYNGRAQGYAGLLMLQANLLNWVRTDWIYL